VEIRTKRFFVSRCVHTCTFYFVRSETAVSATRKYNAMLYNVYISLNVKTTQKIQVFFKTIFYVTIQITFKTYKSNETCLALE